MRTNMLSLRCFALFLLICMCLCGCKKNASLLNPKKPVTITLWHNYGGVMQETMDTLIDSFNATVGKKKGVIINVTAVSSSKELATNLDLILEEDPAAMELPNITIAYPKTAIKLSSKMLIADLSGYFDQDKQSLYVDSFINEGKFDNGLYVFPVAKSTEVLFVNQTLFDRFSQATGITMDSLTTFEGIVTASTAYYEWCGKAFFTADSWFNLFNVISEQQDNSLIRKKQIQLQNPAYLKTKALIDEGVKKGGIIIYDGYSSDLAKTGDVVCSLGSTAGILYYGDTITYTDNTTEAVTYSILPYPTVADGNRIALQRGNGMVVKKASKAEEYASALFLEWLTEPKQNLQFIRETGYLPVTKKAYQQILSEADTNVENGNVRKLLETAVLMQKEYSFYIPPVYDNFDSQSTQFESEFKAAASQLAPSLTPNK